VRVGERRSSCAPRQYSHGVVGAVAGEGVPDVDTGALQPVPAAVQAVPHHHSRHGAAPAQVHHPPRLQLLLGLGAGAVLPVPVHGVDGVAGGGGLHHRAPQGQVLGWGEHCGMATSAPGGHRRWRAVAGYRPPDTAPVPGTFLPPSLQAPSWHTDVPPAQGRM